MIDVEELEIIGYKQTEKIREYVSKQLSWMNFKTSEDEFELFVEFITNMIKIYKLRPKVMLGIPTNVSSVGKTRLDQLYDACCYLAFPKYKKGSIDRIHGEGASEIPDKRDMLFWKCFFDQELRIVQVIIRAPDFQTAFARASDYAARVYFKKNKMVPRQMNIRVEYMNESEAINHSRHKQVEKTKIRKKRKPPSKRITDPKFVRDDGLMNAACGHPRDPYYRIFKYLELKDMENLRRKKIRRVSVVEQESYSLVKETL